MDKRKIRRKRVRLAVHMEPGGVVTMTGDLCPGGVFLYSARVHKPGTAVRLVLRTPSGLVEAGGVVRWSKRVPAQFVGHVRGGMGIEFVWLSEDLRHYLAALEPVLQPPA